MTGNKQEESEGAIPTHGTTGSSMTGGERKLVGEDGAENSWNMVGDRRLTPSEREFSTGGAEAHRESTGVDRQVRATSCTLHSVSKTE